MGQTILERVPEAREFEPYPADGAEPATNPPAFRWLTHPGVVEWEVRLVGPGGKKLSFSRLGNPILALSGRLAPGKWRWQWVGTDAAGRLVGRGRQRTFLVRSGLDGLVVPPIPALARKWNALRPRLFGRRIAAVRRELARRHNDAFRRLAQWCRLAENEPLIPEPEDFGPHPADTEEHNRDWIRIYSGGKIGSAHAARFALSHLLTGRARHLELAKRWALHLVGWNAFGTTGEFINDEASMPMLERLAWVYDWLHREWSDHERDRYLECMQIRGQEVMLKYRRIEFAARPFNNHMCRQLAFLGGAGIAFLGEIPQAGHWLKFVLDVLAASYPSGSWGSDDGGWAQGLSYWSAYMGFLTTFIGAAAELGIGLAAAPYYRNTGYFAIYHLPPYAPRGGFGDHGEGGPTFNHKLVVGTFGRIADDPFQCAYAGQVRAGFRPPGELHADESLYCPSRRWDAWNVPEISSLLLNPEPARRSARLADLPPGRVFPAIGWVSMHSAIGDAEEDAWLEFKSSPYGSISHSHADQNAFNLYAFGRAMLIDSGYYPWYGSPHDALWTRQTWAHNAVLVGGRGQPPWDWLARGQVAAFEQSDSFAYARGEAAEAYNRPPSPQAVRLAEKHCPELLAMMGPATVVRRACRCVLMVRGRQPFFAILDWLDTANPVRFQWLAHAVNQIKLLPSLPGFNVSNGPARLAVRFAWPRKLLLSQTGRFAVQPEGRARSSPNQYHLTAETAEPSTTARFLGVLVPHRDGQPPPRIVPLHQEGTIGARVGDTLLLAPEHGVHGRITHDGLEAEAALVVIRAGELFAAEATRVDVAGRKLLASEQPQTLVLPVQADDP